MKKLAILISIIIIIASSLNIFISLSLNAMKEEHKVEKTLRKFYNTITNRNYTLLFNLSSENFKPFAKMLRNMDYGLVKYKKINIAAIQINGEKAEASVVAEDLNGFVMLVDWILVRDTSETWKMDSISYSIILSSSEKFYKIRNSQKGLYMPVKDPNMIPYPTLDTLDFLETEEETEIE
ncbi:MAG: hypothetical protein LBR28_07780 [Bacteroidales bacterium]|nr:hypothetical protein [Bacteroidales bacterium]